MGTPLPLPKRGGKNFDPCLWLNGWMDQDDTWHGRRPQTRRLCVRWGLSPPPKKRGEPLSPIFRPCLLWPNGCMDQDATLYGGRPRGLRDIVLYGDRARRGQLGPQFLANVRCGLSPDDFLLDGDQAPLPKRGRSPLSNFRPISIVAKRLDASRSHLVWM